MNYKDWLDYQSRLQKRDVSLDEQDYDLPSYFENLKYNPKDLGHLEDTYKKPNHPTFSDQSKYNIPVIQQGGTWSKTKSSLGYPIREKLYPGEEEFFKKNPKVTGMAAEDNSIILNPYSTLKDKEKEAVAKNEALRLYMRNNKVIPNIEPTADQNKFFKNTAYENVAPEKKQTIIARILSGDPSITATPEQVLEAERIQKLATKYAESRYKTNPEYSFKPSKLNLENTGRSNLQRYFNKVESPEALDLPEDERMSKARQAALQSILKK